MKTKQKIKRYWTEIYNPNNGSKIVWFDTIEQGKEYLKKIGCERYAIFDIMEELPF